MKSQPFIQLLRRSLEDYSEVRPGRLILACVSGGADSTALFYGLRELEPLLRFRLAVCHVNHGVRGGEAEEDEAFVRAMCHNAGVAFYPIKLDLKPGSGISEADLRRRRFEAILGCAKETGAEAAVLAHHRDDLTETFLLRLIQGGGLQGLSGFRDRVAIEGLPLLRPLKNIPRGMILSFLERRKITWREDTSNRDPAYLRNRIRHKLLPLLESGFNPGIRETLARTAEHFSRLFDYIREEAARTLERARRKREQAGEPAVECMDLPEISVLPDFLLSETIRLWVMQTTGSKLPPRYATTEAILRFIRKGQSGSLIRVSGGLVFFKEYEKIVLLRTSLPRRAAKREILSEQTPRLLPLQNESFHLPYFKDRNARKKIVRKDLPAPGKTREFIVDHLHFKLKTAGGETQSESSLWMVSLENIPFPLVLRSRREGDTVIVQGQKKSLKKWFGERRIPLPLRDHLVFIEDGKGRIHEPWYPASSSAEDTGKAGLIVEWKTLPH